MIILPDRNIPRANFLMPVHDNQWREPSIFVPNDQIGNKVFKTCFKVEAKSNDGVVVWRGWFDNREDFDVFIWSIACGSLAQEKYLWNLPKPNWQPYLGELITYEFATVTFLSTTGSLQTYTVPSDFNSNANKIEVIGGGGTGGLIRNSGSYSTGGGGGAYSKVSNLYLTIGSGVSYQVGAGVNGSSTSGNSTTQGGAGGDTWFNGATLAASSVGAKGGSGGIAGTGTGTRAGGAGGAAASGIGTVKNSGGSGGTITNSQPQNSSGGGGAAGPNGNGNPGVSFTSTGSYQTSIGGSGDAGSGGAAGTPTVSGPGVTGTAGSGGNGTEFDSTHGSGGGGAGAASGQGATSGAGGNYGGGGGASAGFANVTTIGASKQGLIIITYTPTMRTGLNMPMLGM